MYNAGLFLCISGLSLHKGSKPSPLCCLRVRCRDTRRLPASRPLAPQMPTEIADWPDAGCVVMETDLSNASLGPHPPCATSWRPQNKSWVVEKGEPGWLFAIPFPLPSSAPATDSRKQRFTLVFFQTPPVSTNFPEKETLPPVVKRRSDLKSCFSKAWLLSPPTEATPPPPSTPTLQRFSFSLKRSW